MEHKYTQLYSKVPLPKWDQQFSYEQSACFLGSCFAEHAASFLKKRKFKVSSNPFGILFNPRSIETCVEDCLTLRPYGPEDLVQHRGLYYSWQHHGSFSHPDPSVLMAQVEESRQRGAAAFRDAQWIVLTLGTAVVYQRRSDGRVVANCHRVAATEFEPLRMEVQTCAESLIRTILSITKVNPSVRIVLTVSPIRHWKDGAHANQLSKSVLLLACEQTVEWSKQTPEAAEVRYFPSYEIMLDELRDYRFYASDLMHPSEQAIAWIMQSLSEVFLSPASREIMQEIEGIMKGFEHRVLHPGSPEHHAFIELQIQKARDLMLRVPGIDFQEEILSLHRCI